LATHHFTGTFECQADGTIVSCNSVFAQLFALPQGALANQAANLFGFFASAKNAQAFLAPLLEGCPTVEQEVTCLVQPRGEVHFRLRAEALNSAEGKLQGLRGEVLDTTIQARLTAQVAHLQRLAALGQFTCGIAHDFNNLLAIVTGYADLLADDPNAAPEQQQLLQEISHAAERGAQLTRQLLAYGRRQIGSPTIVDVARAAQNVEHLLSRIKREELQLSCLCEPGQHLARLDPGRLEQALMNLVVNACDASPNGGVITLSVRHVDLAEPQEGLPDSVPPGHYVALAVTDTGIGIAPTLLTRIFDPFFTTKAQSQGTGLGLTTTREIVQQSHGHLVVESAPGQGSVFTIYLPRVEEESPPQNAPAASMRSLRGNETILVVDDDGLVREVVRRILSVNGYTVLIADNAEMALHLAATAHHPVDLLLTDVVMAGTNGPQLAAELIRRQPDIKVVYMSGYPDWSTSRQGVEDEAHAFLAKPFTVIELAATLRQVLDGEPS